jgi:addiction module HigA family antidote
MDDRNEPLLSVAQHPGLILKDELAELGVSMAELARAIDVPPGRISEIAAGKRAITGDTALRLGHWFGTSPQFWLNLQVHYDLTLAAQSIGRDIERLPTRPGLAA